MAGARTRTAAPLLPRPEPLRQRLLHGRGAHGLALPQAQARHCFLQVGVPHGGYYGKGGRGGILMGWSILREAPVCCALLVTASSKSGYHMVRVGTGVEMRLWESGCLTRIQATQVVTEKAGGHSPALLDESPDRRRHATWVRVRVWGVVRTQETCHAHIALVMVWCWCACVAPTRITTWRVGCGCGARCGEHARVLSGYAPILRTIRKRLCC